MTHTDYEIIVLGLTVIGALLKLENRLTKLETLMKIVCKKIHLSD